MSNNWKYSTMTEAEKMKKIAGGDVDLLNTELNNAKKYASLLSEVNADTTGVDNYINALNGAAASKSQTNTKDDTESEKYRVKYATGAEGKFLEKQYEKLVNLTKTYFDQLNKLETEQKQVTDYLKEWFVNNGYSFDGSMASKKLEDTNKHYTDAIKELKENYKNESMTPRRLLGIARKVF